jgi:hypothetical protein
MAISDSTARGQLSAEPPKRTHENQNVVAKCCSKPLITGTVWMLGDGVSFQALTGTRAVCSANCEFGLILPHAGSVKECNEYEYRTVAV